MKKATYSVITLIASSVLLMGSYSLACGDFDSKVEDNQKYLQLVDRVDDSSFTCNVVGEAIPFVGRFNASYPKCPNAKPLLFLDNAGSVSKVEEIRSLYHNAIEVLADGKTIRCYQY